MSERPIFMLFSWSFVGLSFRLVAFILFWSWLTVVDGFLGILAIVGTLNVALDGSLKHHELRISLSMVY